MRELFVWYRVGASNVTSTQRAVLAMQASLGADFPGLEARLLRRDDAKDGLETWMETYAHRSRAGGVDAAVQAALDARAASLEPLIDGDRHSEAFIAAAGA